jgi:hypothetical protein
MEVFIMKALKKWFPLISLICGALALVMIFLPAIEAPGDDWNGLNICFGKKDLFKFSILNLVPYVLAIVGGALAYLAAKKENNTMKYAAIACFAVAAIFFFISKNFVQLDGIPSSYAKEIKKMFDPAIGSILGGIFCLVGAASVACDTFIKE